MEFCRNHNRLHFGGSGAPELLLSSRVSSRLAYCFNKTTGQVYRSTAVYRNTLSSDRNVLSECENRRSNLILISVCSA